MLGLLQQIQEKKRAQKYNKQYNLIWFTALKKSHFSQIFNKCGVIYTIVTAEGILFLIFLSADPPGYSHWLTCTLTRKCCGKPSVFKAKILRWEEKKATTFQRRVYVWHQARQTRGPRALQVQNNIQDTLNAYHDVLQISPAKLILI